MLKNDKITKNSRYKIRELAHSDNQKFCSDKKIGENREHGVLNRLSTRVRAEKPENSADRDRSKQTLHNC
jgi:hypothetical protein